MKSSRAVSSIPGICDVEMFGGTGDGDTPPPELLIEIPHGATRANHFTDLRDKLNGQYPADLDELFFVNTDVGAPEEKKRIRLGKVEAIRYGFEGGGRGRSVVARVTFFPFSEATWRIVGAAPAAAAKRYLGQILLAARSFRPLSDELRKQIRIKRLHVVLAHSGEDLIALGERTGNAWTPTETALINGKLGNEVFEGAELVKILRSERYVK